MALTGIYGPVPRETAFNLIRRALDLGVSHFDTAELYGPYANEELLAEALGGNRDAVEIATKFGYCLENGKIVGLDSTSRAIRHSVEGSLRRLRRGHIDVLYQHRLDPRVPIEDVVGTMSELVREGKVLALGLCAIDWQILQRARAIHPISFVQDEFSLIRRRPEKELIPRLREAATEFVCFSPLGRGILAGNGAAKDDRVSTDYRRNDERFASERLASITDHLAPLWQIAASRAVAPATVALAWLLSKAPEIRVIPGAKSETQLVAATQAGAFALTNEELASLNFIVDAK
ncbi:aldo/keto reductase [Bradyrhizobium sp. PSBB068]|nr:aldo/keto reductase [Bradyrhizobium sp. PSBB068]